MARVRAYFAGKHVLITGGSGGIGLAVARRLVDVGAGVTLAARTPGPLDAAAEELRRRRPQARVRTLAVDVTDRAAVDDAFAGELRSQPLDVLINGAGIARPAEFVDADPADLEAHMDTNYFGAVWTARAAVPHFLSRGGGHLVNIGSTASLIGVYGYAGYTPAKFALYGFSEVLRAELAPRGIAVTIVMPGSTRTPMLEAELRTAPPQTRRIIESTRILSADAVAAALLRAVARRRFEAIPGLDVSISARAYRIAPRIGRAVLDREARR
jgi:3-dehydrosphinganine reductase